MNAWKHLLNQVCNKFWTQHFSRISISWNLKFILAIQLKCTELRKSSWVQCCFFGIKTIVKAQLVRAWWLSTLAKGDQQCFHLKKKSKIQIWPNLTKIDDLVKFGQNWSKLIKMVLASFWPEYFGNCWNLRWNSRFTVFFKAFCQGWLCMKTLVH